jgi:hypothetical protein
MKKVTPFFVVALVLFAMLPITAFASGTEVNEGANENFRFVEIGEVVYDFDGFSSGIVFDVNGARYDQASARTLWQISGSSPVRIPSPPGLRQGNITGTLHWVASIDQFNQIVAINSLRLDTFWGFDHSVYSQITRQRVVSHSINHGMVNVVVGVDALPVTADPRWVARTGTVTFFGPGMFRSADGRYSE